MKDLENFYEDEASIEEKIQNVCDSIGNFWQLDNISSARLEKNIKKLVARPDMQKEIFLLNLSNFRVFCENYNLEFSKGDENILFECIDFIFYISKSDSNSIKEIFLQKNIKYNYETLQIISRFIISVFLTRNLKLIQENKLDQIDFFDGFETSDVLHALYFSFDENFGMDIHRKLGEALSNGKLDLEVNKVWTVGQTKMSIIDFVNIIFSQYCKKNGLQDYVLKFSGGKFLVSKIGSDNPNHKYKYLN